VEIEASALDKLAGLGGVRRAADESHAGGLSLAKLLLPSVLKTPIPAALVLWYDGVARLQTMRAPLGFATARWRHACLDAAGLLDRHGAEMLALGWTAADAFGLHPDAPGAAVDCYGLALLLDGGTVAELTAEGARIVRPNGAELRMRRGAGRPSVPAWELDQGPAE